MVTETERSIWPSAFSSLRESVVLPAPDGEDRTSIKPRRATVLCFAAPASSLFHILDLLAELFDRGLQLKPDIGELDIIGLGAERVRLRD